MAKGTRQSSSSPEHSDDGTGPSKMRPGRKPGKTGKKRKSGEGGLLVLGSKLLAFGLLVVPVVGYGAQYVYLQYFYLPSIVSTPSDLPRVLEPDAFSIQNSPDMFWGSYAANLYFGLRTRSPNSPTFGLMWYEQPRFDVVIPSIRHWSDQGDHLTYGWLQHDGRTFGVQEIDDEAVVMETSFVKRPGGLHGGDWTARVKASRKEVLAPEALVSLILYITLPAGVPGAFLKPQVRLAPEDEDDPRLAQVDLINGFTPELGHFKLKFSSAENIVVKSYGAMKITDAHRLNLKECVLNMTDVIPIESERMKHHMSLRGAAGEQEVDPNMIAVQVTFLGETSLDVSFESGSFSSRPDSLSGTTYDKHLEVRRKAFDDKFERLFGLTAQSYVDVFQRMGKFALSNMLGSISYFHGSSKVISEYNSKPVPYGPFQLFTAIPSRPFFPRGFLWDEGFHHLLIKRWDQALSLEILGSWLDLMNVEGWIPREQILGPEAEIRVPSEYVVQRNSFANPPMFFYLLEQHMASDTNFKTTQRDFIDRAYPRLRLWYSWLNSSQSGDHSGSYRWRGRNGTTDRELNPKTLTSGLDDYPRASHPTEAEYHVDLLCWMGVSSRLMTKLADMAGVAEPQLAETARLLTDIKHIDRFHWSDKTKRYCDFGLHTRNVKLERQPVRRDPNNPQQAYAQPPMTRVVKTDPKPRLVSDTYGYVSLFPFLLQLLPTDSAKLEIVIKDLTNPDLLWTPYGLRSLAKTSPLFNQSNTEHDPPYWRGSIWLNMNYLVVKALHHYANTAGPYRDQAFDVYSQLRANLVANVMRQYASSGFLWEHYNDETGAGEGCHPFTGWTSLILLIMSEKYD